MAYDKTRKIANTVGILSSLMSIWYWYVGKEEECYFVTYIGTSLYLLFLTISFHTNRTKQNAVLYSVIKHSKYAKKMVARTTMTEMNKDVYSKDDLGPVTYFTENSMKGGNKAMGSTASLLTAASIFMDMPFSEAYELCCKPFRLEGENKIKISHDSGAIEYVKITDGWFEPGPSNQKIIVNDSRTCNYNEQCKDILYNRLISTVYFVTFILTLYIIYKVTLLLLKLFKTPIMTESAEFIKCVIGSSDSMELVGNGKSSYSNLKIAGENNDMDGMRLNKIVVTKNIYISKFRLIVAGFYIIAVLFVYLYASKTFNIFPLAGAEEGAFKTERLDQVDYNLFINGQQADKIDIITFLIKTGGIQAGFLKKYIVDQQVIDVDKRDKRETEPESDDVQKQIEKQQQTKDTSTGELQVTVNSTYSDKLRITDIGYLDETGADPVVVKSEQGDYDIKGTPNGITSELKKLKGNTTNTNIKLRVQNAEKKDNKEDDEKPINLYNVIDDKIKDEGVVTLDDIEKLANNIDIDEVVLNENSVADLTCLYDKVLYVTTGSLKARCQIDTNNKGKIMLPYIDESSNIKSIESICEYRYNIMLAKMGNPVCFKECDQKMQNCRISYIPNRASSDKQFEMANSGTVASQTKDCYEEFKIYMPMDTSTIRVKKSVVDSVGNILDLPEDKMKDLVLRTNNRFNEYEQQLQSQQDQFADAGIKGNTLKQIGYIIRKPSNDFTGMSLTEKRSKAKNWLSKYQSGYSDAPVKESFKGKKDILKIDKSDNDQSQKINIVNIDMKGTINKFGEGTYITNNFYTQFDDIFSGSVFLAQNGEMDDNCKSLYSSKYHYAACTKSRRQIVSCEPDLWGEFTFGNSFKCRQPTKAESVKMPAWRKGQPSYEYSMPIMKHARELELKKTDTSFTLFDSSFNGNLEVLWGKSYQDTVQQSGSLKYFIYSFVVKISITSRVSGKNNFIEAYNKEIDKFNRWENRNVDNPYKLYKEGPMAKSNDDREVPSAFFEISNIFVSEHSQDMLQDRSYLNIIFKSDIYAKDMRPIKRSNIPDCNPTRSEPCTYLIPIYYAIRLYGPARATVKLFGVNIEEIGFWNNICSSVNAISVRGLCYMFDETQTSTDVMAGGYPWTEWSGVILDRWTEQMELPSFYLYHPKIGSGQYLSKVSTTANIGAFSINGKCKDTYYRDGQLMCEGNNATNLNLVEYSTFHRPLTSIPNCTIKDHVTDKGVKVLTCVTSDVTKYTVCNHNPSRMLLFNKECIVTNTKKMTTSLKSGHGLTIKTPMIIYQVQKGSTPTNNKIHYIIESWYRSTIIVSIMLALSGIGYIMFFIHVLLCIFCYINGYTIGKMARFMGVGWIIGKKNVLRCKICNLEIYNDLEKNKHAYSCKNNWCPYCITLDNNNKLSTLEFSNRASYREHAKSHRDIRLNPYSGYIGVRRRRVAAFKLVPLAIITFIMIGLSTCEIPQEESGLRSNRIGTTINIPNTKLKCDNQKCSMITTEHAQVPLVDGAAVTLRAQVEDRSYAQKITIRNPNMKTSCEYLYSSAHIKRGPKRLVYSCTGKSDCNAKNEAQMLLTPIGGNKQSAEYIPIDVDNPLKSYNCPKAIACRSPIIDFMWMTAGCYSVNDGTAVGYEYYMPDILKEMVHVFKCKIDDIAYSICNDESCKIISGQEENIEKENVEFEHIKQNLPTSFTIGVNSVVGNMKPDHIFHDLPNVGSNVQNTMLTYRLNKIPQGDTCLEGTEYNDGTCEINESGSAPNLLCKSVVPEPDIHNMANQYTSLSDVYNCNFEETSLTWNTAMLPRKITVMDKVFEDTQTYSWPSITLRSKNCMFGYIGVDLMTMDHINLDIVKYEGEINSVKCSGFYNRNQKTILTFSLTKSEGIIDFKCENSFTDSCVFDTSKSQTCNVTTLLPFVHKCKYNKQVIEVDCSKLELSEADPTSGHSIGWTGSDALMTWPSGIKIMLTNWWGLGLMIVSVLLLLVLIAWVYHVIKTATNAYTVSRMTGKRLASHNDGYEHVILDDEIYEAIVGNDQDENNGYLRKRLDNIKSQSNSSKYYRTNYRSKILD